MFRSKIKPPAKVHVSASSKVFHEPSPAAAKVLLEASPSPKVLVALLVSAKVLLD